MHADRDERVTVRGVHVGLRGETQGLCADCVHRVSAEDQSEDADVRTREQKGGGS